MKKFLCLLFAILLLAVFMLPCAGIAEETASAAEEATVPDVPDVNGGEPFTWSYLATIAGAAAFTLLFVQLFKVPLDKVWKIPTRAFAYIVSLAVMIAATAFTTGLTLQTALLAAVNALVSALMAYGSYEVTFAKLNK